MIQVTPNAELAYQVLDYIDAHPDQHDQSDFVRRPAELLGIGSHGVRDDAPHALFYDAQDRQSLGHTVAEIFGPRPQTMERER